MEEAAFSKKKSVFHQQIGLKFQQETIMCHGAEHCLVLKFEHFGQ